MNTTEDGQPLGLGLSELLGPLPEGREYIAGMNRHFAKVCGTVTAYSAEDMRAYAQREVAAERERWQARCAGKRHDGCAYLATCGNVCNKCGQVA